MVVCQVVPPDNQHAAQTEPDGKTDPSEDSEPLHHVSTVSWLPDWGHHYHGVSAHMYVQARFLICVVVLHFFPSVSGVRHVFALVLSWCFLILPSHCSCTAVPTNLLHSHLSFTVIFSPSNYPHIVVKATWSVRGFLFLLQNHVNQYKL